jgi:leucyl/phenylalanyl-tRNA--protein transferase
MPYFLIPNNELIFPHPSLADKTGILGIGGDLSPERLLLAYQFGIFPWFNEDDPIIWWCPDPRFVLEPSKVHISKSMRPYLNQEKFRVSYDQCFNEVIENCKTISRNNQDGTWITDEMETAYIKMHQLGYAHSVEVWQENKLVGGLYGMSLGKVFFGESMFALESNASKLGFIKLCKALEEKGFKLIDCQQDTPHLRKLGGKFISRKKFLEVLANNRGIKTERTNWQTYLAVK